MSLCQVCTAREADLTHASAFAPYTFSDCALCRAGGAEPYDDVVRCVASIFKSAGGVDAALRPLVEASCAVAGKSIETFQADVEAAALRARPVGFVEPEVVGGDVRAFEVFAVPIATGGRPAGALAESIVASGASLPDVPLGRAQYRRQGERGHVYVAVEGDAPAEWTPTLAYDATWACLVACLRAPREQPGVTIERLAIPAFGAGTDEVVEAMRNAAVQYAENGAVTGFGIGPRVVIVRA